MSYLKKVASIIKLVLSLGIVNFIRTVYFNLKYLPFDQAKHLPVFIAGKVKIKELKRGKLIIDNPHLGSLIFGKQKWSLCPATPSYLHIEGVLRIKGSGFHNIHPGYNIIIYRDGYLEIGDNFSVAFNLKMSVTNKIIIGKDNMWSYQQVIIDSDVHKIFNLEGEQINKPGEIKFGDNVWLGARCTVLKNISIAHDSIIGSSSIISKPLEQPHSIYAGCPAKLIKTGINWKRDFLVPLHP